jgi:hypothetical protein
MIATSPSGARKKLYAEALLGKKRNLHKLTVTSRNNQPAETVKKILKSRIHPIDMKISIRTLKGLKNGKVLIEVETKDDIEKLKSGLSPHSPSGTADLSNYMNPVPHLGPECVSFVRTQKSSNHGLSPLRV